MERGICRAAGFDRDDRAWFDPVRASDSDPGNRLDDPDKFRRMLRTRHGPVGSDTRRLIDARSLLVDPSLANFGINGSGQATTPDVSPALFLTFSMRASYIADELAYGFKKVLLSSVATDDSAARFVDRIGVDLPANFRSVAIAGIGTHHHPVFEVSVRPGQAILQGEFATNDAPLCLIEGMNVDESVFQRARAFDCQVCGAMLKTTLLKLGRADLPQIPLRRARAGSVLLEQAVMQNSVRQTRRIIRGVTFTMALKNARGDPASALQSFGPDIRLFCLARLQWSRSVRYSKRRCLPLTSMTSPQSPCSGVIKKDDRLLVTVNGIGRQIENRPLASTSNTIERD